MAMTAAVALAVVAAAAQTAGPIIAGKSEKNIADAQAKVAKQQASQEERAAAQKERDFRRKQRATAASVRAAGGARGIELGVGSPLLSAVDFTKETERQALRIREGGEIRASRFRSQASLLKAQGKAAFVGGIISGVGSGAASGSRSAALAGGS